MPYVRQPHLLADSHRTVRAYASFTLVFVWLTRASLASQIPVGGNKSNWTPLGQRVNVDEAKCPTHPSHGAGRCQPAPPTAPPPPLPYEALGSVDVGTGESS